MSVPECPSWETCWGTCWATLAAQVQADQPVHLHHPSTIHNPQSGISALVPRGFKHEETTPKKQSKSVCSHRTWSRLTNRWHASSKCRIGHHSCNPNHILRGRPRCFTQTMMYLPLRCYHQGRRLCLPVDSVYTSRIDYKISTSSAIFILVTCKPSIDGHLNKRYRNL